MIGFVAPVAPATSRLQVVELTRLGVHTAAWDELVLAAELPTSFLRTWWLDAVTDASARFVLVVEDGRLVGGLALRRDRVLGVTRYTALGAGRLCPDHLDLLAEPGRSDEVARALRAWFERPGSRVVDLDGLRDGADVLTALPRARLAAGECAVWEPLTPDAADYFRARSKNFRTKVRGKRRRLAEAGVVVRRTTPAELPAVLHDFVALHQVRPDRRPLLRLMPVLERALRAGSTSGEVLVHVAEQGGRCCGVLISFTTGGRLATYQIARSLDHDLRDVGTLLYASAIEDACASGFSEIDFLRGEESYKLSFTSRRRELWRARTAHGPAGHVVLALVLSAERCRRALTAVRSR